MVFASVTLGQTEVLNTGTRKTRANKTKGEREGPLGLPRSRGPFLPHSCRLGLLKLFPRQILHPLLPTSHHGWAQAWRWCEAGRTQGCCPEERQPASLFPPFPIRMCTGWAHAQPTGLVTSCG